jgi:formylglycine-generating enzyme
MMSQRDVSCRLRVRSRRAVFAFSCLSVAAASALFTEEGCGGSFEVGNDVSDHGADASDSAVTILEAGFPQETGSPSADAGSTKDAKEQAKDAKADAKDASDVKDAHEAGCSVGALSCSGEQPQSCTSSGAWKNVGAACTGGTPVCLNGGCVVCSPEATGCNGQQPQTCDETGTWQDTGTAPCSASTTCVSGSCLGVCGPTQTQCSGNGVQSCDPSGQWGSAVACPASMPTCDAGSCGVPPSCQVAALGTTNCGVSGESCCTSPEVTGGTFYSYYDPLVDGGVHLAPDGGASDPSGSATVSSFRLDKYEVTVGRFRQFVAAWNGGAGYVPAVGSGKHKYLNGGMGLVNSATPDGGAVTYEPGWVASDDTNVDPTSTNLTGMACANGTWTASASSNENLPINCVEWAEAYAFCIWDGGFLPGHTEWEYAAAGGSEQREYPWGSTAPGTTNEYAIYGCYYPSGSGTCTSTSVANIAPVGKATLGVGLWGQLDLEGNMLQWTLDWFGDNQPTCVNCALLTQDVADGLEGLRTVGGAAYGEPAIALNVTYGGYYSDATQRTRYDGIRCARTP